MGQGSQKAFVTFDPTFHCKPWNPAVYRIHQVTGGIGVRGQSDNCISQKGIPQFHSRKVPTVGKTMASHGCQRFFSTLPELRAHKVDFMLTVCPSKESPNLSRQKGNSHLPFPFVSSCLLHHLIDLPGYTPRICSYPTRSRIPHGLG